MFFRYPDPDKPWNREGAMSAKDVKKEWLLL